MSRKTNRILSSIAAWVFGLATSVLFISLWGRAVVIDTSELGETLRPMAQSEQVAGMFSDWMTTELVESGVPAGVAENATESALATDEVSDALETVMLDVVAAASSDNEAAGSVDVAAALQPTVPAVTAALVETGMDVTEPQVSAIVDRIDPLIVRRAGEAPIVGGESKLARRLGTAAILAVLFQLIFGAVYVLSAWDRLTRVRTLLSRFAVGGLSFAVLLKLGSWVLDPAGGRAPVSESLSLLADSKWAVPALLGGAAAIAAFFAWLIRVGGAESNRWQYPERETEQPHRYQADSSAHNDGRRETGRHWSDPAPTPQQEPDPTRHGLNGDQNHQRVIGHGAAEISVRQMTNGSGHSASGTGGPGDQGKRAQGGAIVARVVEGEDRRDE